MSGLDIFQQLREINVAVKAIVASGYAIGPEGLDRAHHPAIKAPRPFLERTATGGQIGVNSPRNSGWIYHHHGRLQVWLV